MRPCIPANALDCIGLAVHIFRLSAKPGWIRLLGTKLDGTDMHINSEQDFQEYLDVIARSSLYATLKVSIENICFDKNAAGVPENLLRSMYQSEPRIIRPALVPASSPRYKTLLAVREAVQDEGAFSAVRVPKTDQINSDYHLTPVERMDEWIFAHIVLVLCELDQLVFDLCRQEAATTDSPVPEDFMNALKEYVQAPVASDTDKAQADSDPATDAETPEGAAAGGPESSANDPDPMEGVPDGSRGLLVALIRKSNAKLRNPSVVAAVDEARALPDTFREEAKRMMTAMFGAFAYLHHKEMQVLKAMRKELMYLNLFQHFVGLVKEHKLVPEYEMRPLKSVITMIEEQEKGDDQPKRRTGAAPMDPLARLRSAADKTMNARRLTAALNEDNKDDKKWPAAS